MKHFEFTEPHAIRKLVEQLGSMSAAGVALGLGNSSVSKMLTENKTRKVNELAATALLDDKLQQEKSHILFVKVETREHRKLVQGLCRGIGVKCMSFVD